MRALSTSLLQLCPPRTTRQNKSLFSFFLFMHKDASFKILSWLLELPRVITGWGRQCRFLARLCLKWHCYNYCVSPGVSAVAINCRPQTRQFKHADDVLLPFCLFVPLLRKRHHGINVGARHAAANYGMRSGEKSNAIIFILVP